MTIGTKTSTNEAATTTAAVGLAAIAAATVVAIAVGTAVAIAVVTAAATVAGTAAASLLIAASGAGQALARCAKPIAGSFGDR